MTWRAVTLADDRGRSAIRRSRFGVRTADTAKCSGASVRRSHTAASVIRSMIVTGREAISRTDPRLAGLSGAVAEPAASMWRSCARLSNDERRSSGRRPTEGGLVDRIEHAEQLGRSAAIGRYTDVETTGWAVGGGMVIQLICPSHSDLRASTMARFFFVRGPIVRAASTWDDGGKVRITRTLTNCRRMSYGRIWPGGPGRAQIGAPSGARKWPDPEIGGRYFRA
jgi:hypothetical protein